MKVLRTTLAVSGLAFALVACSSHSNLNLERAEIKVRDAQNNQTLMERSASTVNEAAQTLDKAQRAWNEKRDREEVDHLVYLTERRLDMANQEARREIAVDEAALQRDRSRLAAFDVRARVSASENRAQTNALIANEYRAVAEENRVLAKNMRREILLLRSRETERGMEFTVADSALFETGRADLKPGALHSFSTLEKFLNAHPERSLIIEGHTDNIGDHAYNRDLSQRRAEAVRQNFIRQGIDGSRLVARGMGEAYPVAANSSSAGRLHNRRVELILEKAGA